MTNNKLKLMEEWFNPYLGKGVNIISNEIKDLPKKSS